MNPSIPDPDNQDIYGDMNKFFMRPIVLGVIFVLFLLAVILSLGKMSAGSSANDSSAGSSAGFLFGNSQSESSSFSSSSSSSSIITLIAVAVMIVLIMVIAAQYLFGISVATSISNVFNGNPQVNVAVEQNNPINTSNPGSPGSNLVDEIENDLENWNTKTKNKMRDQVFNIPGNYYSYDQAKVMCDAYGARLAKYSEIEDAYNKGGEWCNYGWSDGQNAFFPTQQGTFDQLQTIKGHEHDCGRPGVNGGYIANPKVKFGVNCFGPKPNITQEEEELMETSTPYPKTEEDIHMEKQVAYWKHHLNEILISPFNYNSWST